MLWLEDLEGAERLSFFRMFEHALLSKDRLKAFNWNKMDGA
jgi:hypothetical protein